MKLKFINLATFLFLGITGFAQTYTQVKGNVKEEITNKFLESATVAIIKIKDSSLVKVTSTNKEGNFIFEDVIKGSYRIMTSYVGYKKNFGAVFNVEGTAIDLGTLFIVTEVKSLNEVSVVIKKLFIERKIDKTVINVDASILNAGGTAMDILEASPGVSVDKNGNISLKGKSGVNIMIDGKPAYLSGQQLNDLLKRMPASALDQVEIMTNPSAKYDAAGNSGIINIKTKKNKTKGFNGNVSASYGQNISYNNNNSSNINYRNGKFNLFGNYSFSDRTEYRDLSVRRKFRNETTNEIETIFDQQSFLKKKSINHNAKLGIDYFINDKTTFGIVLNGDLAHYKSYDNNTTLLQSPLGQTDSSLNAINHIKGDFNNKGVNLNFKHRFDSIGNELTADLDYIVFNQHEAQLFNNDYFNADMSNRKVSNQLLGSLPATVNIYSAKMDFTHPLKNGAKFETGIKSSFVKTDNIALYDNLQNGLLIPDYGKTNHFRYIENINAGYINYNRQIKKWGIQVGLRVENTTATGHQLGNQVNHDSTLSRNYTGLFPTVFVSYNANKNNTFSANIGRRIGRPDYQSLNPFYYFLDDYTYRVGNTQLKSQYTNQIELSHTYKGFLTTILNYSKTTDLFTEVYKQITSERKIFVTQENIASRQDIGITTSASIPVTKIWNSNIYANVVKSKFKGNIDGGSLNVSGTLFMGNLSNQFKFNKGWNAELNGWYRSKGIEGQIIVYPMWAVGAGVQKEILKKKGTLKLGIRDAFNSQQFSGLVKYHDIDAKIVNNNHIRTATLTFTYRFGKALKTQQRRNTGGAGEEQNRIKKG